MSDPSTNPQFIQKMRQMRDIKNRMAVLNQELGTLRAEHAKGLKETEQYVKSHNMLNTVLSVDNAAAKFVTKNTYSTLSFKYIQTVLSQIVSDEAHVDHLMNSLRDGRTLTSHVELKFADDSES
jgi:hypothetical protein